MEMVNKLFASFQGTFHLLNPVSWTHVPKSTANSENTANGGKHLAINSMTCLVNFAPANQVKGEE